MTDADLKAHAEAFIFTSCSPDYDEVSDYFCDLEPDQVVMVCNYIYDAHVKVSWP